MEINASKQQTPQQNQILGPAWRGLGFWNFYFLGKFALYLTGYINFDLFYNALFFAALVFPLRPLWLHRLRQYLAIPIGIAVLYHDTWFPPFSRLLAQPEVLHFSSHYLLELIGRFINWNLLGAGFIFLVVYLFLAQWFRLTLFTVVFFIFLTSAEYRHHLPFTELLVSHQNQAGFLRVQTATAEHSVKPNQQLENTKELPLNELLDQELNAFYSAEKERRVTITKPLDGVIDFDILFFNICSLSWADLRESNLLTHTLFEHLDVIFDDFNSVTTYSGPAVTRLKYSTCGQRPHDELYQEIDAECSIFENLKDLGFETRIALNPQGEFQNFNNIISRLDPESEPFIPSELKPALRSFYGAPLWNDLEVLNLWMGNTETNRSKPISYVYNSVTLHDGNREATAAGGGRPSPYEKRAQRLLNEIEMFMADLEAKGKKTLVVFIPEHGAALQGDRMQIPGMREIPTPQITHIPVGV